MKSIRSQLVSARKTLVKFAADHPQALRASCVVGLTLVGGAAAMAQAPANPLPTDFQVANVVAQMITANKDNILIGAATTFGLGLVGSLKWGLLGRASQIVR